MKRLQEWNRIALRAIIMAIALAGTAALTTGCVVDDDGPAEEAEDAVEESVDATEDAIDDAADETEDAVDEVEDEIDGSMDRA